MVTVLTVSDEVVEGLWNARTLPFDVDLVLGAGDLPFEYLEHLAEAADAPCVFVPGNHDADLTGYSAGRAGWMRAGLPSSWPGPDGAVNADRRIVSAAGLRIAGLGGSIRYRDGPNQWTERQQKRRSGSLIRTHTWHPLLRRGADAHGVDVLLTHSPPFGLGDAEDAPHRGFRCLDPLTERLRPQLLVHGHIHPHGTRPADRQLHGATVINTVGYALIDITPGGDTAPIIERRRHGS
ncbi:MULTISPECIES: metallophosphoesterase [Nocardiaceae]|uniref:Icc-related predicted phosphoesterase n=1 Tax=Rhodococcoides corynebacterioides TaxID=53972 RepID=A0ABS2KQ17_9NOCA|nr:MULTISPECIES: metallophosphoesterase [Rhodococcus]MBM7414056.1 Icc-related predicted phosphoesterase [Rhodococcus corynebacterioides]MBP1116519.1 Icc-related predicted phosphoesterase [Rhodococcus sp. PvP016]